MMHVPHTWIEDPADHAREHHEEHREQFEVAAHDTAGLHMGDTASCKAPLHNHLEDGQKKGRDYKFLRVLVSIFG